MARHKLKSPQFLYRAGRDSRRKTTRCGRLALQLEQLEPRLLMNGDTNPAPLAAVGDSSAILVSPAVIDSGSFQPPVTFPLGVALPLTGVMTDFVYSPYFPKTESANRVTIEPPETMFQSIEEARTWLAQLADDHFGDLFGTTYTKENPWNNYPWYWDVALVRDAIAFPALATFNAIDATSSNLQLGSFSETNVQVEGVDEADLVETDGRYLYLVSGHELLIVDAGDAENIFIASRIRLDEAPMGMYLSGDRLTLVTTDGSSGGAASAMAPFRIMDFSAHDTSTPTTTVTILDLSDRTAPALVQKTEIDGRLVSSRMVDGQLRLVLQHDRFSLPKYLFGPRSERVENADTENADSESAKYVYETRAEYLARMEIELIEPMFPGYRSFSLDGSVLDENPLIPAPELLEPESWYQPNRTTIATFDVLGDEGGPADTLTFSTASATTVYATQDNLYVFGKSNNLQPETAIWKFDFDGADHSIRRIATGSVPGSLLNQFAADQHDGYLRVVTTTNPWDRAGQSLLVLEQVGRHLKVVGSVDRLAPGERLHSVRFLGNRAFVVTFQKVDPLFAIDLSDPTNPTVAGELKIPGYSDYLQPIDEDHLLGIGRGADAQIGLFQELQISIFDVSDLNDPRLAHRYSFDGGRSTTSIATGGRWTQGDGDHHAVSYFPSEQILAIPIASADQGGGFRAGVDNTPIFATGEGGLQVFSIDLDTGFESLATIEHDSPIIRSLRIGETLFAFSAETITTHDIVNPADPLDTLPLLIGSETGLIEMTPFQMTPFQTLSSAANLRMLITQASTQLSPNIGGPSIEHLTADIEALDPNRLLAFEVSLPALSTESFHLPTRGLDSTDSVFSAVGLAEAHDIQHALDNLLLDELVRDMAI